MEQLAGGLRTRHFWVATYPFFESWLVIGPVPAMEGGADSATQAALSDVSSPNVDAASHVEAEVARGTAAADPKVGSAPSRSEGLTVSSRTSSPVRIAVFDPDGNEINSVTISPPVDRTTQVDLDPLLGALKLEGGIKHCHVAITCVQSVWCRLVSSEGGSLQGELVPVNTGCAAFFPLTFSSGRSHAIAVVNHGDFPSYLKVRLFCGSRSPELVREVPARGSRLISLTAEFGDLSSLEDGRQVQGYVRLTTKSGDGLGVQLIERARLAEQKYWYSAVS